MIPFEDIVVKRPALAKRQNAKLTAIGPPTHRQHQRQKPVILGGFRWLVGTLLTMLVSMSYWSATHPFTFSTI
jgi:hypothetical protein